MKRASGIGAALVGTFSFLMFAIAAFGQAGSLDLRLTSDGKPVAARVYIIDSGGATHRIPVPTSYNTNGEKHWVVDGAVEMPISPGAYHVRVEKGPEYAIVEKKIEILPGKTQRLQIEIPHFVNMNSEGWYSGDLHNHRNPADMPLLLRAEDLNIGPAITRHLGPVRKVLQPYPEKALVSVDDLHVIGLQVQEVERNQQGHGAVIFLNDSQPIQDNLSLLFPTVSALSRKVKAHDGFVDAEKPMWKNVPINVAFGLVDSIGVVNNHFHPHDVMVDAESIGAIDRNQPVYYQSMEGFAIWMTDLYYSFLNCGFRLSASAGSATGVMAAWPGYERVYVYLTGGFSYRQWFQDLKAGHSIATNGPLMRVRNDGHPPGVDTEWKPGAVAHLDLKVDSQRDLNRVEVIFNGKVVQTIRIPAGSRSYHSTITAPVPEAGWLAVRCLEAPTETIHYAQSSPFYFPHNGKLPVHAADARRWADFVHDVVEHTSPNLFESRADYNTAIGEWKQAEEIYRKLAAQAMADSGFTKGKR
jgi:hypothetical protein